ncbi:hypothetical protein GCM10028827_33670 [Mucilaginibacter myungsuensis]
MPNILLILGLSVLLFGECWYGYKLHKLSAEQTQIKEDYNLSNNITFGIFSVDEWRERIAALVNKQVSGFSFTKAQKKAMQKQVETQLYTMVHKTVRDITKPQKTFMGKLTKIGFKAMVKPEEIDAQVPSFARTIVNKVTSPASERRLKRIAGSKINELVDQTYDSTNVASYEVTKYLYKKYKVSDPLAYNKAINNRLNVIKTETMNAMYAMLGCVAAALVFWLLMRKQVHLQATLFVMSILFAVVMLVVGTTASIIDLDARIKTLEFSLMGEKVGFINQVLFFQSKSLWGVITTLISQAKPDAIVVGALLLLFVVILPLLRMIARSIYLTCSAKIADSKVIQYLAFHSGKWDMADVMVVGIAMTYIGLNGILKSQLSNLNINAGGFVTTTVNNTSLQPGYYVFVAYVVFAFILSYILKGVTPSCRLNEIKEESDE